MLPAFLPILPLLSGVPYAVQEIPEKWQWILAFNPMTAVISGWRWAVLGASRAELGAGCASVPPSGSSCSSGVLRSSALPSRGSRTRSDADRDRRARTLEALPDR